MIEKLFEMEQQLGIRPQDRFHNTPNILILPGGAVGNTTRIVDYAVQQIFAGEEYRARDHNNEGRNARADNMLLKRILRRLHYEHSLSYPADLTVNHRALTVRLKQR